MLFYWFYWLRSTPARPLLVALHACAASFVTGGALCSAIVWSQARPRDWRQEWRMAFDPGRGSVIEVVGIVIIVLSLAVIAHVVIFF